MTEFTIRVYDVPKVCKECGALWTGKHFKPAPEDGTPVLGTCAVCLAADEASVRALAWLLRKPAPVVPRDVELRRPRRTEEWWNE